MVKKKKRKYELKEEWGKNGFLKEVKNPSGKKPGVYIFQGSRPGFSARYIKSQRILPSSSKNAEGFARTLARKGHKKVIFRD